MRIAIRETTENQMNTSGQEVERSPSAIILKVLARWAPHARHDFVGACSPMLMNLSLIGIRSKKNTLTGEDMAEFIGRGQGYMEKILRESEHLVLLLQQDRDITTGVADFLERTAGIARTHFANVELEPIAEPTVMGREAEYDLTIISWTAIMALLDHFGPSVTLTLSASRCVNGELSLGLTTSALTADAPQWSGNIGNIEKSAQIRLDEVETIADHLDFRCARHSNGFELRRRDGKEIR